MIGAILGGVFAAIFQPEVVLSVSEYESYRQKPIMWEL